MCTLSVSISRGFKTDKYQRRNKKNPIEDIIIDPEMLTHNDVYGFILEKGGSENVRTLSELQAIYIRAPSVPAGDEDPGGDAEWSIYFILIGIYILYYVFR